MKFILLGLFSVQLGMVVCELLPPKKCVLTDSACLKTSGQELLPSFTAGAPELGVEVLDVMHIDTIKFELAGLQLNLSDVQIKGLKKAVIDKLTFDQSKKQMQLSYHADILMKGQYKAGGMLLVLPISGDGDITIKLKNIRIDITAPFEITKNANGKDVIELGSHKFKYDVKDNANFQLTNLFNGNKQLSETMLTFMNENWKLLSQEFGRPLVEAPVKKIFASIKTYFKSQPKEDIVNVNNLVN